MPSIIWDIATMASSAAVAVWVFIVFFFLRVLVCEEEVGGNWRLRVEVAD